MKKAKALVIDDERIVLDSVNRILSQENFRVDVAQDSRMGLNLGTNGNYDVLLTDIRMPGINGMRIVWEVKRAKPQLPVIIITGYATVESAVRAIKLGAADYIEKPFTPDDLIRRVTSAIDRCDNPAAAIQQGTVHRSEVLRVLDRAASDPEFVQSLFFRGADALDEYILTAPEKLALLTGDVTWIGKQVGALTEKQREWLESRKNTEIW